jgi:hypothetical protein
MCVVGHEAVRQNCKSFGIRASQQLVPRNRHDGTIPEEWLSMARADRNKAAANSYVMFAWQARRAGGQGMRNIGKG